MQNISCLMWGRRSSSAASLIKPILEALQVGYTYTHIHLQIHTYICTSENGSGQSFVSSTLQRAALARHCMRTHTHTHTHTHTQTHTHTHTHTHTSENGSGQSFTSPVVFGAEQRTTSARHCMCTYTHTQTHTHTHTYIRKWIWPICHQSFRL